MGSGSTHMYYLILRESALWSRQSFSRVRYASEEVAFEEPRLKEVAFEETRLEEGVERNVDSPPLPVTALYPILNFSFSHFFTCSFPPVPTLLPKLVTCNPSRLLARLNATYS